MAGDGARRVAPVLARQLAWDIGFSLLVLVLMVISWSAIHSARTDATPCGGRMPASRASFA